MHTLSIVNKSMVLKLSMNCSSGKIGPHLASWFQDKMTGIPKGGAFRVSRPSGNGLARAHFLWNVGYAHLMASSIFRGALSLLMAHFSLSEKQNPRGSECPEKIISSCPFELTFLIQASVHCPREQSVMVTFAGRLRNPRKGLQGSRALPPHTSELPSCRRSPPRGWAWRGTQHPWLLWEAGRGSAAGMGGSQGSGLQAQPWPQVHRRSCLLPD